LADTFVDFKIVKARVSIEDVLRHHNIRLRRVNQHSLRGKCPLPTHSSQRSIDSFVADTVKNVWACQSSSCVAARDGKRGGNVLDLVACMERCSIRDAAIKLQTIFLGESPAMRVTAGRGNTPIQRLDSNERQRSKGGETNRPLSFTLKGINPAHPYLRRRGLKPETLIQFGCGYFPGRGSMAGRVVIPIHNERGELIAYAGRAVDQSKPKYKLPSGFRKSEVLFNFHRVVSRNEVIVVEGFFDCMKLYQAGVGNVVALMGSALSDRQRKLLAQFARVILLLDGDDAGREGARTIALRLATRTFVKIIELPSGEQPDRLSTEQIKMALDLR
jgi:DNA primase